jgi:hypothetical protein
LSYGADCRSLSEIIIDAENCEWITWFEFFEMEFFENILNFTLVEISFAFEYFKEVRKRVIKIEEKRFDLR